MAYCCSPEVDWPGYSLSWFPYDFGMGEAFYVSSRTGSSTSLLNAEGKPIGDLILPSRPGLFVPGDVTPLPTIQARVHRWLLEYH